MPKKKESHCTFRNDKLFCTNCGGEQAMPYPMQVEMFSAITKAFEKIHKNCLPVWKQPEPNQQWSESQKAQFWLQHGERGISSNTIFKYVSGLKLSEFRSEGHPCDPDDFRRCYLLLKAVPEWRQKLDIMRPVSEVWNKLVDNWDKLTEMLETALASPIKAAPEMYELMISLGC